MDRESGYYSVDVEKLSLNHGKTGSVHKCNWNGQDIAVKYVDIFSYDPRKKNHLKQKKQAYATEVNTYSKLKEVQGKCIPRIVIPVVEKNGEKCGFGMQLLSNELPCDFRYWSKEQKHLAVSALKTLITEGNCIQKDIAPWNFGMFGENRMLVIDLAEVCSLSSIVKWSTHEKRTELIDAYKRHVEKQLDITGGDKLKLFNFHAK